MPLNTQNAVNQAADQQTKIDNFNSPVKTTPSGDPDYLKWARVAGAAGAGADWLSTYDALKRGAHESNPTLQWTHDNPLGTALAGAGQDVLTSLLLERALKNHPKVLSGIYAGRGIYGGLLAGHNLSIPGSR